MSCEAAPDAGTVEATGAEREVLEDLCLWARDLGAEKGKPQFTAAVLRGAEVLSCCRNEARETGDPTRHAEVVAIGAAARAAGSRDLSGAVLLSSCQPCEMCLAAMRWARIDRVIYAARQSEIDAEMFRFPALHIGDYHAASGASFDYAGGYHEDIVRHLYRLED